MSRIVTILLLLLAIVTFFLGLRMGKYIQKIDTPVKIEYKMKEKIVIVTATLTPKLLKKLK
ncbi:MAG: hypothetical protein AAB893_01395 [Patescibacteria group bacterium]